MAAMRRWTGLGTGLAVVGLIALALLAGCGKKKQIFTPELGQPDTYVFVQFPADTDSVLVEQHKVNHLVHLYWFGTFAHGDVAGYRYRFLYPGDSPNKAWTVIDTTDQEFSIYTPDGLSTPTFQVAAFAIVDGDTLLDPSPAEQRFAFTNRPPTLSLTSAPAVNDTTYASLTLFWNATDPDGDNGKMRFRVWLSSDTTDIRIASSSPYTLPSDMFYNDSSTVNVRETVWVQAVDDGGMLGSRVNATWIVRRPVGMPDGRLTHGRLLLLDDLPTQSQLPNRFLFDSIYVNTANRLLPGQYDVLRTQFTRPFKSNADLLQTLRQFDAVVWYRGPQGGISTVLQNDQAAVETYLQSGGKLYLEGLNLFSGARTTGAMTEDFVPRFLNSDGLMLSQIIGRIDSTANLSINSVSPLYSPRYQDSLRTVQIYSGLRGFAVRETSQVAIWARAGSLTPANDTDIPIAVIVDQAGGGRCAIVTLPMRGCDGYITAGGYLTKLLRDFLGL